MARTKMDTRLEDTASAGQRGLRGRREAARLIEAGVRPRPSLRSQM